MMSWMWIVAMAPAPGGEGQQQSPFFMFGWLGLMLVIFYFLLIRPQQRREKERRALLEQIKTGDRVVFSGGILGVVANVKEKTFTVKVDDGVKLEVVRSAVAQVLDKGQTPDDSATTAK